MAKTLFAATDFTHRRPVGPRILIYHQVGSHHGRQMEVPTDVFIRQLDWLSDNRRVVDLRTALDSWRDPGSDQLVVLSFDDGYADTYETVFPILADRGMAFVIYVSTAHIEDEESLHGDHPTRPLSWDQIGEMSSSGLVEVAAHTHTHSDLRGLGADEVAEEIEVSDRVFSDRLGMRPTHFAYPWGYWSETADRVVRERYDTSALGGFTGQPIHDGHLFHRYPVQLSDGFSFFKARLRRGLTVEESVRRRLRGYSGP